MEPTPWAHRPARILLVLGGTDPLGLTHLLAEALSYLPEPATVTAVLAPGRTSSYVEVSDGLRLVTAGPELPNRFADADVVVSAAGTTIHELCHIGVPSAIVCVADNQRSGYDALVSHNAVIGLGDAAEVSADPPSVAIRVAALLSDPDRYRSMSVSASHLVDGRGAQRILDALGELTRRGPAGPSRERRQESR